MKVRNSNKLDGSQQIKFGAILSYLVIAVNLLAGLLYTPWMIRTIGPDNYGLYTLAISLISMFLLDFGMGAAVSRFISKYNAENKQDSVKNLLGIVYKLYILIDAIVLITLVIIYFFVDVIYIGLTPNELANFKVVYIIAGTFSVISFPFTTLNGILTAHEKFVELKLCELFNRVVSVILIVLALLFGFGLYGLVTINAVSGLVTIIIKLFIIRQNSLVKVNFKFNSKIMLKDIFSFSIWSTVTSIAERLIFNITPSILGAVSGSISIALFGVASTFEGYVFTFASAVNGMFLPNISRVLVGDNAKENILKLMIKIGRIQLSITGLIVIGFISVGKDFIFLWLGEDYILSYYSAIVLILPSLIWLTQDIANTTVVALNKVKLKSLIFIGTSILNIILSIAFSRLWGMFGSSLAICISYFIRSIAMNVLYYRVLKINIFKFFKECHMKMAIPLLLSLSIGYAIHFILPYLSWKVLFIKGCLIAIAYMIIMWFMCFNLYEKDLLKSIFQGVINRLHFKKG